jgi:hypothetical protein
MTKIYVNFGGTTSGNSDATGPWLANNDIFGIGAVGLVKADLLDNTDSATGVSLYIDNDPLTPTGVTNNVVDGVVLGDWTKEEIERYNSFDAAASPSLRLTGLPANTAITFETMAYQKGQASRDTAFTVNGVTETYDNDAPDTAPNPPIVISSTTSSSGELVVDLVATSIYGRITGFIIEYASVVEPTGPSITNIDGDNAVQIGQNNVVITGTNIASATSVTISGKSLPIV